MQSSEEREGWVSRWQVTGINWAATNILKLNSFVNSFNIEQSRCKPCFLLIQEDRNIFYRLSHKWPPVDLSSCWKPHFYFCSSAIVCFCHETGDRKELAAQVSRCQWAPGSNYLPASSCLLTQVHAGHMYTINQVCWAHVHNNQVHAGHIHTINQVRWAHVHNNQANVHKCKLLLGIDEQRTSTHRWAGHTKTTLCVAWTCKCVQIYIVQCNGHWYAETWASFCF